MIEDGIVKSFPPEWRCTVQVIRGGGTDKKGNPLPEVTFDLPDCLVGWRTTKDPIDMEDLSADKAALVHDTDTDLVASDRIRVPQGNWAAGLWRLDGTPRRWPLGVEVILTRDYK